MLHSKPHSDLLRTIAAKTMIGFKTSLLIILLHLSRVVVGSASDEGTKFNNTQIIRRSTSNAESGRGMAEDYHELEKPKSKPWLGYYDFLVTEGSYKFWVVFQLFTIGILIYSAFAAIYYAKYTFNDYENYDDYFLKRSARWAPPTQTAFLGLPVETYAQIFNAIANYNDKYT